MKIVKATIQAAEEGAVILSSGGLVIYPTETTYGAGVDATNDAAVQKLGDYKKRPMGKPYSIAVTDQKMAEEYVELNETARNLYKRFLPGPMTVVSRCKNKLAKGVASELGTVGVRIPDYKLVIEMVRKLGKPITATSANASYQRRPYKVDDVWENLSEKQKGLVDLIIDAGELPHREPSTVIDTTMDEPAVLRLGEIGVTADNKILSRSEESTQNTAKELWQKYEQYSGSRAIVFALSGPMGVGKTVFCKGLGKAMGIGETITSPTYAIEERYQIPSTGGRIFDHIDAWRMVAPDELDNLGIGRMITDKSVLAIEWADRVAEVIRNYNEEAVVVWVKMEYGKSEKERHLSWEVK